MKGQGNEDKVKEGKEIERKGNGGKERERGGRDEGNLNLNYDE